MSDQDAAQTEKEMREHERQARERNPDERSADDTQDSSASGMTGDATTSKGDPDDAAPPANIQAGNLSGS
jgi:hypothetical protein